MIGDRWKDIIAGQKSKCKTILLNKKYSEKHKCEDYTLKFKRHFKNYINDD